jgi:hypothetical protein
MVLLLTICASRKIQCEPEDNSVRDGVAVNSCLAPDGSLFMWLRNVTSCQICCSVKTLFQPGMAVQRMPC